MIGIQQMQQETVQQQTKMGLAQSLGYYRPNFPPDHQQKQYLLMTYRSGIVPVDNTTYYKSDSGWGCMLRVAQMFVANLLYQKQYNVCKQSIIKLFYDNLMVPFSIQRFTKVSKTIFPHLKPYDWYTPCQAGFLVKQILQQFDTRYKVIICNDGSMFLDDITRDSQSSQLVQNQIPKQLNNRQFPLHKKEEQKQINEQKPKSPVHQQRIVVLLMARIGLDQPQAGYLKCVTKFMQNEYFVSIMGGTPRYAHLILQYFQGYFGYIDPHTTRPVVPDYAKVTQYTNQYTSKPIWIRENKIDSSMCIGFCFLKSETDKFWQSMTQIKEEMKDNFFIYMDVNKPEFDDNAIIEIGDYSDEGET